jgi:hypothetical protein
LVLGLLPPYEEDFEIGWQLKPVAWGGGRTTEASHGCTDSNGFSNPERRRFAGRPIAAAAQLL